MAITIHYQNQVLEIPFETLPKNANASYLFGLPQIMPRPLCTGMGKCGRCKVRYHSDIPELSPLEQTLLNREEQENNIRLACKHPLQDNAVLTVLMICSKTRPDTICTLKKAIRKKSHIIRRLGNNVHSV